MLRLGGSCVLSQNMVTAHSKVIETRRFLNYDMSDWYGISQKCINEKKFLIVTICIDKNDVIEYFPTESQWRGIVEDTITKLLSLGANKNNTRIDIINEPVKPRNGLRLSTSKYIEYINWAHEQIGGRLEIGCGNEEFITAGDMYLNICQSAQFEYLVGHFQGSCDSKDKTSKWANYLLNLCTTYKKKPDVNETNLKDPTTSSGYDLLKYQMESAEKIGCLNFCMVFENLDTSAFIGVSSNVINYFKTLSFSVNGGVRGSGSNYNDWKNLANIKAPIPNIIEIKRRNGMILPATKYGTKGYLTELVEELLELLGYEIIAIDGNFGNNDVLALKAFQADIKDKYPNIVIDGICGRKGYFYLINEITDSAVKHNYEFKLSVYGSPVE